MANEDTVQIEFYAPWPNLGKKFSQQLGEIRTDTASLAPLVRGIGLDANGDFTSLDGIEKSVIQSREWGKQDFHNKFRMHYDKDNNQFDIAYNTGTEVSPNWYTTWAIDSDGHVSQQNTPTTASNLGDGTGIFKQKSGVDLEFKTLKAFYPLSIRSSGTRIDFHSGAERNTYSSLSPTVLGGGPGAIETIISNTGKAGVDFPFKAIEAGPNMSISTASDGQTIVLQSTAQVVEFYGIVVMHADGTAVFPGTHILKVNPDSFYLTKQIRSNEVLLNSRGDNLTRDEFVAVIGDDMTGPLLQADGTVSNPSFAFTTDPDTGLFLNAIADLAITVAGSSRLRILDTAILPTVPIQMTSSNDAANPDYAFFSDTNTGLYQLASNDKSIAFATNGVRAGWFDTNRNFFVDGVVKVDVGTPSAPAYTFRAETNTGMYRKTTDQLAFATEGLIAAYFDANQNLLHAGLLSTSNAPGYSFVGDENTGMYRRGNPGDAELAFATDGVERMYFTDTAGSNRAVFGAKINVGNGSASAPTYSFTATGSTGLYRDSGTDAVRITATGVYVAAFDSTLVTITQPLTVVGRIKAHKGSPELPSYNFTDNADIGMYWRTTDSLGFAVAGGLEMRLNTDGLHVINDVFVADEVYSSSWDSALTVPTKNAVYDKIESLSGGSTFSGIVRASGFYIGTHDAGMSVDLSGNLVLDAGPNDVKVTGQLITIDSTGSTDLAIGPNTEMGFAFNDSADTINIRIANSGGGFIDFNKLVYRRFQASGSSVSSPALSLFTDTNTGIHWPTGDKLSFVTGAVEAGYFDANQNLHVTGDVRSSRVEAGIGVFYTQILAADGDSVNGRLKPGYAFLGQPDTGLYLSGNNDVRITINEIDVLKLTTGQVRPLKQLLLTSVNNPSAPDVAFVLDTDTGIYQLVDGEDLAFSTGGVAAGHFDANQNLHVTNDVRAGRIHSGPALFYTQIRSENAIVVSRGKSSAPAIAGKDYLTSGMYWSSTATLNFAAGGQDALSLTATVVKAFQKVRLADAASVSAPSIQWSSDTNTGLYQVSAGDNSIAFATDGTRAGYFDANQNLHVTNDVRAGRIHAGIGNFYTQVIGAAGEVRRAPSFSFRGNEDSGMYYHDGNSGLGMVTAGTVRWIFGPTYSHAVHPIRAQQGTVSAPQYTFLNDPNTGMWQSTTSEVGKVNFGVDAQNQGYFDASGLHVDTAGGGGTLSAGRVEAGIGVFYTQIQAADVDTNARAYPHYSFIGNPDTGHYLKGDGQIRFSINGTDVLDMTASRVYTVKQLLIIGDNNPSAPGMAFITDTNTGLYQKVDGQDLAFSTGGTEAGFFDQYQNFYVTGNIEPGGQVRLSEGTEENPGITFANDTNTGWYRGAADRWNFRVGGTSSILEMKLAMFTVQSAMRIGNSSLSQPSIAFSANTNTGFGQVSNGDDSVQFITDGVEAGHFDSSRNLWVTTNIDAGGNIHAQGDVATTDDAYAASWDGSSNVPTKNAVYDKIESIAASSIPSEINTDKIVVGTGLFYEQICIADGTVSDPGLKFIADPDTGLYLRNVGQMSFTVAGVERLRLDTNAMIPLGKVRSNAAGPATVPVYSFNQDSDTGIFSGPVQFTNQLAFSTGGVMAGYFDANQNLHVTQEVQAAHVKTGRLEFYIQQQGPISNAVNRPAYSFRGDTDTGMTRSGFNTIRMIAQGGAILEISADHVRGFRPIALDDDSTAAAPALRFADDTNTGIFQTVNGGDDLSFTTGGTRAGYFDDGQNLHVQNDVIASRIHAGPSVFYASGQPALVVSGNSLSIPSVALAHDTTSGFGGHSGGYPAIIAKGSFTHLFINSYTQTTYPIRIQTQALGTPQYTFLSDPDTGWGQNLNNISRMDAIVDGTIQGIWDKNGLSIVQTLQADKGDFATSMNAPTGTFYTAVDIGTGAPGDSIIEFYDEGTLKYTVGHDTSLSRLAITSGSLDGSNEIVVEPNCVTIDVLKAGSIEAGTGTFYTSMVADKFHARLDGSLADVAFGWEADIDTGMYRSADNEITFGTAGAARLTLNSTFATFTRPILAVTLGNPATADYAFDNDADSGMYQRLGSDTDRGNVCFAVSGQQVSRIHDGTVTRPEQAYKWQFNNSIISDDGIEVRNDVIAGRVHAGPSVFYATGGDVLTSAVAVTVEGRLKVGKDDGATNSATPQITFNGDATAEDSGFGYNYGANYPFVTRNAAVNMFWVGYTGSIVQFRQYDSSVGTPGGSFQNDTDTGIFRVLNQPTGQIRFSSDGTEVGKWQPTGLKVINTLDSGRIHAGPSFFYAGSPAITTAGDIQVDSGQILADGGAVGAPGVSFKGDPNTGLYQSSSDTVNVAAGGAAIGQFTNTYFRLFKTFRADDSGAPGDPSIVWQSDTNTGLWHDVASGVETSAPLLGRFQAADTFHVVTGGTVAASWDQNQDSWAHGNMEVLHDLRASRVEAGIGVFYTSITSDRFLGNDTGTIIKPQHSFSFDTDTGLAAQPGTANGVYMMAGGGSFRQFWSTSNSQLGIPLRLDDDSTAAAPALQFRDDLDTGIFQTVNAGNDLSFSTGGTRAGYFDSSQNLHVTGDIISGGGLVLQDELHVPKIVAGTGLFYESIVMGSSPIGTGTAQILAGGGATANLGYSWIGDTDTGIGHGSGGDQMFFRCGSSTVVKMTSGTFELSKVLRLDANSGLPPDGAFTGGIVWGDKDTTGIYQPEGANTDSWGWSIAETAVGKWGSDKNLHVVNDVRAGRIYSGPATFYTQIRSENAITVSRGKSSAPAIAGKDYLTSGMYWSSTATLNFAAGGQDALSLTATVVKAFQKVRLADAASVSAPSIQWSSDTNTGLYQVSAGDNSIAFATDGTRAGYFDANQNLHVTGDVRSSRVEAGIGFFYIGLDVEGDLTIISPDPQGSSIGGRLLLRDTGAKVNNLSLSFVGDPDTGIYRHAADTIRIHCGNAAIMEFGVTINKNLNKFLLQTSGGSVDSPALAFNSDTNCGLYQDVAGSDSWSIAAGGIHACTFLEDGAGLLVERDLVAGRVHAGPSVFYIQDQGTSAILVSHGKTGNPAIAATHNTNTGLHWTSSALVLSAGSTANMTVSSSSLTMFKPINLDDGGTAALPSLRFRDDNNTGIYQKVDGGDDLAFSTAGAEAGFFDANQNLHVTGDVRASRIHSGPATFYIQRHGDNSVLVSQGAAGHPSYSWTNDDDTGIWNSEPNMMDFACQGSRRFRIRTTAVMTFGVPNWNTIPGTATAPVYSWLGDTNTGMYQNSDGDDSIAFTTGGTRAGYFDSSQNLNVTNNVLVADDAYDSGWNADLSVPTKNAVFDKIETISGGGSTARNLIVNSAAMINQRVNCTATSEFTNADFSFCLDHVLLVSDGNDAVDVIQNTAAAPDGASHCFELDTETSNKKFGLIFPLENLVAAELLSAADDRKCSITFKYKSTSGVQNIRARVLSWQGTVDAITDPVLSWESGTADTDVTMATSWTSENAGSQIATSTSWQTHTLENIAIDTANTNNVVLLIHVADIDLVAGTDKIYIADVHLNEGATVSTYIRPTVRHENDDCVRFMMKSFPANVEPTDNNGITGSLVYTNESGNEHDNGVNVRYDTPMFKAPSTVFYYAGPSDSFDGQWFNTNDNDGDGLATEYHGGASGMFITNEDNSTTAAGDRGAIHYTAVAEIVA